MKSLKKIIAMIMALGTLSTMGLSANADTIVGDSQNNYIAGDINLDGKLNVSDIIISRRILLHLAQPVYLYAYKDNIKVVEAEPENQMTLMVTDCIVNLDNDTIHVTGTNFEEVYLDITLKITGDTKFLDKNATNLKDLKLLLANNGGYFYATCDKDYNVINIDRFKSSLVKPSRGTVSSLSSDIAFCLFDKLVCVSKDFNSDLGYYLVVSKDTVITKNGQEITWDEVVDIQGELSYIFEVSYVDGEVTEISVTDAPEETTSMLYEDLNTTTKD